ncbi:MAG TPA: hypothetical protein VH702_16230 [Vicinamibacterales bacterium]|jgi:hypothetical protein
MDKVAEIKRLYLQATRSTIRRDLGRAVELLKSMGTEEERERAAVYMDGLSQMRSEWALRGGRGKKGDGRQGRQKP